jgi:hypothetical protein
MDAAEAEGKPLNIVFSDESRFCMGPDMGWVRARPGKWNSTATVATTKYPLGVMVWGCIGVGLKPDLVMMSHHVNAAEYKQAVLGSGLIELAAAAYGADGFFFMQDGASMHLTEGTLELLSSRMRILAGWPPNSPDYNPIEMLWAIIGHRLAGRTFANEAELFAAVKAIWEGIHQSSIDALVLSFRHRLETGVAANGGSISQIMSSHMSAPRPQDIANVPPVPPFTAELDGLVRSYVEDNGRKWTQMGREVAELNAYTPVILKNRFIQLEIEERNAEFAEFNGIRLVTMHPEVIAVYEQFDADLLDAVADAMADEEDFEEPAVPEKKRIGPRAWFVFARESQGGLPCGDARRGRRAADHAPAV